MATLAQIKYWESLKGKTPKNITGLLLGHGWNRGGGKYTDRTKIKMSLGQKKRFQNNTSWNKGLKMSAEFKKKISIAQKGKKRKPHTEETKKKLSIAKVGDKNPMKRIEVRTKMANSKRGGKLSLEIRKKMSDMRKGEKHFLFGKHHSEDSKKKMSEAMVGKKGWNKGLKGFLAGEKSPHWIVDRSLLKKQNRRNDPAYKEWRKSVWERDTFRCRIKNKDCFGRIEAHHILGWAEHVELRYKINNGITLCHAHHPRKRAEEKRLSPYFQDLVSVSKTYFAI